MFENKTAGVKIISKFSRTRFLIFTHVEQGKFSRMELLLSRGVFVIFSRKGRIFHAHLWENFHGSLSFFHAGKKKHWEWQII